MGMEDSYKGFSSPWPGLLGRTSWLVMEPRCLTDSEGPGSRTVSHSRSSGDRSIVKLRDRTLPCSEVLHKQLGFCDAQRRGF